MRWRDCITLIATLPQGKDDSGFVLPVAEQSRTVYCSILSIGQKEFYSAAQAGIKADVKCEIYSAEYQGESTCELNGRRYTILRTFSPQNGEFIELTLSDLRDNNEIITPEPEEEENGEV